MSALGNSNRFRSSSLKSLKSSSFLQPQLPNPKLSIISKHPFQINPPHVVFKNIQSQKDYQIKVQIRNLTKKPQRIRFQKFNNKKFTFQSTLQPQVAVGLSIFVIIKYQCNQEIPQTQVFKIYSSDGFKQELQINTYPKQSKIVFQPFVNLGFVQQGSQCIKRVIFQNQGEKAGLLQFVSNDPTFLIVQPLALSIQPKHKKQLTIKYKPNEAGYFKGLIEIKSKQPLAKSFIQVLSTSLQKARFIINPDKQSPQASDMIFDFRTVYSGQKKTLKAFLINNSPKQMNFTTIIKKGILQNLQELNINHTPFEQALQQKQKIFKLKPDNGIVQPFSQAEISIICQSKIGYKQRTFVSSYALADYSQQGSITAMKNAKDFKFDQFYQYTAILKSIKSQQGDQQKPLIIQLKASITCPQIKINKKALLFGDCLLTEHKTEQLVIENKNKFEKVSIQFKKIPYFDFTPDRFILGSQGTKIVNVTFNPKTIGKIDLTQVIILNQLYQISIRCMGIVKNQQRSMSQKQLTSLNNDAVKHSQSPLKSFHSRRQSLIHTQRKTIQNQAHLNFITHKKLGSLSNLIDESSSRDNRTSSVFIQNKEKFSKLLTSRRQQRQKKVQQLTLKKQYSKLKQKLIEKYKKLQTYDDEGLPESSPVDVQFEIGSSRNIKQRQPSMSKITNKLFVNKHIGEYQPQVEISGHATHGAFTKTIEDKPKRIFPQFPQISNHKRQIQRELSIQELQLIQVPQTRIYFGEVYIKSQTTRYFWIRNNTRFAISCRIFLNNEQLQNSYFTQQTIPTCQQAAFPIVFCKNSLGEFVSQGYYIINERFKYSLNVTAKVGEVRLSLNKENLNFEFTQTNLQLCTSESVTLSNPGNSEARFKFTLTKQKYFIPTILQGCINAHLTIQIPITLTVPLINNKNQKKPLTQTSLKFQQKLSLKILDGAQRIINCLFQMQQPKFNVKCDLFSKKSTIFLNNQFTDFVELKSISKEAIVLHLQLQGGMVFSNSSSNNKSANSSSKIRLMPDQTKRVKVKFVGQNVGNFKCSVNIIPRGGLKRQNPIQICVISPQIMFSSQQLNMDPLIVKSTKGQTYFSLTHKQQIPIPLVFDFRPKKYNPKAINFIQFLQIKLLNQNQTLQAVTITLKSQQDQNIIDKNLFQQQIGIDQIEDHFSNQSFDDQQENLQKDQLQLRRYRLVAKPGVEYKFRLEFIAPQIHTYCIKIPIQIQKSVNVENSPVLSCQAIQPKFIFDPSNIDFKKKYLAKPDRSYPKIIEVFIKNENYEQCQWYLDLNFSKKSQIFYFDQNNGNLKPNQQLRIKAMFNPISIGEYQQKLPLFIKYKKQQKYIKFCDVSFKGSASLPFIFFNKRQVIMPVVPLGIQTHTFFRILNDGYDNCSLKHEFEDDIAGINVKVTYPQGNNISLSRNKLKIDLTWKFDRPMSFTLLLTFKDDNDRKYTIPISGTTDNSILTNYMYFLRNQHHFNIKQQGALQLVQLNQHNTTTTSLQRKHSSHSLKSNATNRSIMSYLGVTPINPYVLATTLEYIKKYLNENILSIPINQFPQSIVQNDGKAILEVLAVTSGKSIKYPWIYQGNSKGQQRVKKLLNQYNQMIKMFKIQGALLNHLRPQYLLSFQDLNLYLSTLSPQKSKFYMPNLLKINSGLYNYLSVQSWITLLYQILKINILSRVTPNNIKEHIVYYKQKQIPLIYLQQSNFISTNESILLNWCEQAYHQILLKQHRITNFDKEFKNGLIIGALIQRYAKNNLIARMILQPKSEQDQKKNAKTICDSLQQMGLLGHIQAKYIFNPFQREMIMLLTYLYMYLPAYIPQQKHIVFKCVLGEQIIKSIELKNPSTKIVKYKAKYTGSSNFIPISDDIFIIEPKSSFDYKIKFVSKFVRQIKGRISFFSVKDTTTGQGNSLSASAIVFQLKSETVQILSEKVWKISSNLYQSSQFSIQVQNNINAPENTQFQVKLRTQYIYEKKKKSKTTNQNQNNEHEVQVVLLKNQTVKVKKGQIQSLSFTYLPMSLHKTKTYLLFSNQFIGEFQHQIQATAEQPALTAQVRPSLTMYANESYEWEYILNPRNEFIVKARKNYEALSSKKTTKNSPLKSKAISKNQATTQFKDSTIINKKFGIVIDSNPFVSLIQNSVILNQQKKDKPKQKQKSQQLLIPENSSQNSLKFKFTCKEPVFQFSLTFLVKDKSEVDIRRYRLLFTILPKPLIAVLQMTTPARKQLVQNLPFINNTQRDWNMKVTWFPGNGFSIPSNFVSGFIIKRQSMINLPLTFKPRWKQQSQAKLTVSNPVTLDQFQYKIKGTVQDPLAQDHIDIKCQINQKVSRSLQIYNPYSQKAVTFKVQTTIPNFAGESKITLPPNGKAQYNFSITPMVCAQFTSCISFQQIDGPQYFWYTVLVATNSARVAKVVELETEIRHRKIQKIKIPINFKLNKRQQFEVTLNGQGLIGPSKIFLQNEQHKQKQQSPLNQITIQYLPLRVGSFYGSLYLVNPEVGEVLIDLNLVCHAQPPNIGRLLRSPLGVGSKEYITLQNPINQHITIRYKNSNPQTFIIHDHLKTTKQNSKTSTIRLSPFQKKKIMIEYIPGNLQNIQKSEIIFYSQQVGSWQYHFSGIGIAPTQFQPLLVYRQLKNVYHSSVKFRNPFNYVIAVGVKLLKENYTDKKQQKQQQIFRLNMLGASIFTLQPHGVLEIPFTFFPTQISRYFCTIKILLTQKIFWCFPIIGVGQCIFSEYITQLKLRCRQSIRQEKQICLQSEDGVGQLLNENNQYEIGFWNVPEEWQTHVELFFNFELTKQTHKDNRDHLTVQFNFKPMKPFKTTFDLVVDRVNGGRWDYKISLQAIQPLVDDKIQMQSNLMTTSNLSFKISNWQKKNAQFKAYFTADSGTHIQQLIAHQFSVQPQQGTLTKYGGKGTQIYLSFTPVEYGKDKKAKLIIQTKNMYWSYQLIGRLPKYIPPTKKSTFSIEKQKK